MDFLVHSLVEDHILVTEDFLELLQSAFLFDCLSVLLRLSVLLQGMSFASGPNALLVVRNEVLDLFRVNAYWSARIVFFCHYVVIKHYVLIHSYQVVVQFVVESSEFSFLLGGDFPPLFNFDFQVINGLLGLEYQLLKPFAVFTLSLFLIVLVLFLHIIIKMVISVVFLVHFNFHDVLVLVVFIEVLDLVVDNL